MPEPTSDDLSIGERIARYRRALGLTQEGLAMRLFRSKSWVTMVERGERPLDSPGHPCFYVVPNTLAGHAKADPRGR
jgi:DNA-binding transcriptional regulator YiaG